MQKLLKSWKMHFAVALIVHIFCFETERSIPNRFNSFFGRFIRKSIEKHELFDKKFLALTFIKILTVLEKQALERDQLEEEDKF